MQNNNGVKQSFLACFLKILDKKRKKWRELLADQYLYNQIFNPVVIITNSTNKTVLLPLCDNKCD
jgi:hypothetical protein